MKIMVIADLHISGKNFERAKLALSKCKSYISEQSVDVVVFTGDVFDKFNIADRFKTVGELQSLILEFVSPTADYFFLVGNHDYRGSQKSALEFLRAVSHCVVVDTPCVFPAVRCNFGFLPWIDKGQFIANFCKGMSKTDSDLAFNAKVQDLLGIFKAREDGDDRPLILFGHLDIAGTKVNGNYIVESDGYSFNQGMLEATGADVITLGHIHKRDGYYAGALYQQSFGDEGNHQGFEVYTINRDGKIEQKYVNIDLRPFETVEIHDIPDIPQFVHSEMRLRFHSDEAYIYANSILDMSGSTVEICFNKRNHVARSEMELTSMMSDEELLLTYMTLNPIPDSITDEDIRKVLMI